MVNSRRKFKKTRNTPKTCFSMEDSDHHSTQSGALVGSSDDLLTEILLRLPVTSILRFKSVSKHWRLLLSDRHFTQRYDINNLSKSPGLFAGDVYVPYDVENPSPPPCSNLGSYFDRPRVRIMQSCNGLLLCSTHGPKGSKGAPRYYVFNPTTKQLALISPIHKSLKVCKTIRFMGLAYHQTDCPQYKVVCVRCLEPDRDLFQIQIYSSDTREWKISIKTFSAGTGSHVFQQGVYWNGAVYWTTKYHKYLYFKLDVEKLQMQPLPMRSRGRLHLIATYFRESRGCLHLIPYHNHQDYRLPLNVYEMFSDHSSWFVKYQVVLNAIPRAFPDIISRYAFSYDFKVIDLVRGEEEEEDTFVVLKIRENIIKYNVHDKSFKHIYSLPRPSCFHENSFHRYTETLSSF
ncbi:putative F-box domain-containing protein [Helianthus annuus]|nr:putative F-box domain-containing protein [Helianthus annuus]KAJ0646145.1 putative F-box domain-containing protein [Helianthus annuus]KAJ0822796.1 putative F-box domain-containing protein [Helianthus annuus]